MAEREEDEAKVLRLAMGEEEDRGKFEDEKFTVESEVDWGASGSESGGRSGGGRGSPVASVEEYPAPPPFKKQTLTSKGPPRKNLLDEGWRAIIGTADYSCRLALEFSHAVYCCSFGNTLSKPGVLRR